MSLISEAIETSFTVQRLLHGDSVIYAPAASDISIEIPDVVQGNSRWKGFGAGGVVIQSESVDFFIPVAELVDPDGELLEPQQFDRITTLDGFVYDVQPFGSDELLWRWHDRQGRTIRRIYTKLCEEPS